MHKALNNTLCCLGFKILTCETSYIKKKYISHYQNKMVKAKNIWPQHMTLAKVESAHHEQPVACIAEDGKQQGEEL